MAEIKDKVVTVESLNTLHEHNKNTYAPMINPILSGTTTIDGDTNVSGEMKVSSLMIGSNVKLVPTNDYLEIVFLN